MPSPSHRKRSNVRPVYTVFQYDGPYQCCHVNICHGHFLFFVLLFQLLNAFYFNYMNIFVKYMCLGWGWLRGSVLNWWKGLGEFNGPWVRGHNTCLALDTGNPHYATHF